MKIRKKSDRAMPKFLFVFGYERPSEWRTNTNYGTDFESSNALWVIASDKEHALAAGRRFAERWVKELFNEHGMVDYEGWTVANYANWIEDQPFERFSGTAL